jgi:hypothetical protein
MQAQKTEICMHDLQRLRKRVLLVQRAVTSLSTMIAAVEDQFDDGASSSSSSSSSSSEHKKQKKTTVTVEEVISTTSSAAPAEKVPEPVAAEKPATSVEFIVKQ